jgi:hypothetical protein
VTVRSLREWFEPDVHLDISNAPFDPQRRSVIACGWKLRGMPQTLRLSKSELARLKEFRKARPRSKEPNRASSGRKHKCANIWHYAEAEE